MNLSVSSGINADCVYNWLMDIGKQEKKNPVKLHFRACSGRIINTEEPDLNYIETVKPERRNTMFCTLDDGPDYEGLILDRDLCDD